MGAEGVTDDYYNEKGEYLYTDTRTSDDIRIISQEDFDNINSSYFNEMADTSASYENLINALDESSNILSINITSGQLQEMQNCSNANSSISSGDRTEINALITLNISDKKNPSIELNYLGDNNGLNTYRTHVADPVDSNGLYNGNLVIGSAHTHPNKKSEGFRTTVLGQQADQINATVNGYPVYQIYGEGSGANLNKIDRMAPNRSQTSSNIMNASNGKALGRDALEIYGKK